MLSSGRRIVDTFGQAPATTQNARAILALTSSGQTFAEFLWRFVDGTPIQNNQTYRLTCR